MGEKRQVTDTAVELETVEPVESAQPAQPVPVSDEQLVAMLVEATGPGVYTSTAATMPAWIRGLPRPLLA